MNTFPITNLIPIQNITSFVIKWWFYNQRAKCFIQRIILSQISCIAIPGGSKVNLLSLIGLTNQIMTNHILTQKVMVKGVLHLWALFLKTLCIFSKNKATSDKVSYGSGQKCSKELENYSFTSVETIVVKLQWKMCENQYFPCFEP